MSKKSKKEPLAATAVATAANAIVNEPNVQSELRLAEMQASVRAPPRQNSCRADRTQQ